MNGVHDLGGMHGFGRVEIEEHEPVFHAKWEGRTTGLLRILGQLQNRPGIDGRSTGTGRAIIESMEPLRYLTASYYERFLAIAERRALESGAVTEEELEERTEFFHQHPNALVPRREDPEAAGRMRTALRTQGHPMPEGPAPRFSIGDPVRARNLNPPGHTRLPRYIRGKCGVIVRVNGWYAIQDADASELGPNPQTVYTARFEGREVWGPTAEPNLAVHLELWEGYLEPA